MGRKSESVKASDFAQSDGASKHQRERSGAMDWPFALNTKQEFRPLNTTGDFAAQCPFD